MKTRMIALSLTAALCWSLSFAVAAADEVLPAQHPLLRSMNQAEFETYRRQLDLKVKGVASVKPKPDATMDDRVPIAPRENEIDRMETKQPDRGYGKGYGARMGPGNNGAFRGSSMSGGGGRNR